MDLDRVWFSEKKSITLFFGKILYLKNMIYFGFCLLVMMGYDNSRLYRDPFIFGLSYIQILLKLLRKLILFSSTNCSTGKE